MKPWMRRVLFYGGSLVVVTLMCQGFTEDLFLSVLGDDTGQSAYDFVRTNVEAPISLVVIALYLDLILARRPVPTPPASRAP